MAEDAGGSMTETKVKLAREYRIKWKRPNGWDPSTVLQGLPSPIAPGFREIYNYSVEKYGFYFVDQLVDSEISAIAFKSFIDEALSHDQAVVIEKITHPRDIT